MTRKLIKIPPELCIKCRGSKMLCGLTYCPVNITNNIKRVYSFPGNNISGSSPPSLFVGKYGYPKIGVYPALPPFKGDTSYMEDENKWLSMNINDFIEARLSLLRGKINVNIDDAKNPDYKLQEIQLTSLSGKPVDIEMVTEKSFNKNIVLDENITPMGPSSGIKNIKYDNYKIDNRIEKVYYDGDLKADDAMINLYRKGMSINNISKALSIGSMGIKGNRKIVPTRWSITAADKNISDNIVDKIKDYSSIDEYYVYVRSVNKNLFIGILTPGNWMFEWGESWFPGTTWNYFSNDYHIELDYEGYYGRKTYPDIGGCYYSSRLGVAEKFDEMKRSGRAILWREIYNGFNIPLGVWYVRDNIRELFKAKPEKFDNIDDVIKYVSKFTRADINEWVRKSYNIKNIKSNLDVFL